MTTYDRRFSDRRKTDEPAFVEAVYTEPVTYQPEMAVAAEDGDTIPAELPGWFDFVVLGGICLLAVIFFTAMYWGVTSWL